MHMHAHYEIGYVVLLQDCCRYRVEDKYISGIHSKKCQCIIVILNVTATRRSFYSTIPYRGSLTCRT